MNLPPVNPIPRIPRPITPSPVKLISQIPLSSSPMPIQIPQINQIKQNNQINQRNIFMKNVQKTTPIVAQLLANNIVPRNPINVPLGQISPINLNPKKFIPSPIPTIPISPSLPNSYPTSFNSRSISPSPMRVPIIPARI